MRTDDIVRDCPFIHTPLRARIVGGKYAHRRVWGEIFSWSGRAGGGGDARGLAWGLPRALPVRFAALFARWV